MKPARVTLILIIIAAFGCDSSTTDPESGIDLTGDWSLVVDQVCTGTMTITASGGTFDVSGNVGGEICPFNASGEGAGSLEGSQITFGIGFGEGSDEGGSGFGTVNFSGVVAASENSMSGTYSGSTGTEGQWQATRQ